MKVITLEEIHQAFDFMESLSEKDTNKFIRKFQKKQEPLLVYLAALVEREELNDPEQDMLIDTTLILWKLTQEACVNQKMLTFEEIEGADNGINASLEKLLNSDEAALQDAGVAGVADLEAYGQPELVDFVLRTVMEDPEDAGVREEMKGMLFLHLSSILALLLKASA